MKNRKYIIHETNRVVLIQVTQSNYGKTHRNSTHHKSDYQNFNLPPLVPTTRYSTWKHTWNRRGNNQEWRRHVRNTAGRKAKCINGSSSSSSSFVGSVDRVGRVKIRRGRYLGAYPRRGRGRREAGINRRKRVIGARRSAWYRDLRFDRETTRQIINYPAVG